MKNEMPVPSFQNYFSTVFVYKGIYIILHSIAK